jgi:50S ribosomal subunit-associated GTPase HflX
MTTDLFDFGFTAVDESELEAAQQLETVTSTVDETQDRLDRLFNAIQPLLTNLKLNPEKEYILWPNRLDKIEEFEAYIQNIYKGS